MYKLWLKVNKEGVITQTLFGNFKGEPLGFDSNFVVEDRDMISALRNSTEDWYVRDNRLRKKETVQLKIESIKPEDSEDDIIRANGVDKYRVTVQDCSSPEVDVWLSREKIVLPTDDELILTSKVSTTLCLEAKGVGYKNVQALVLEVPIMPIHHEINKSMPALGMPTEAITQSLCDTRGALEALLNSVNSMVRMQEEMLDKLGDIEEAIRAGTEKANEGIAEAQNHRAEIATARDDLKVHTEELKGHKDELKKQRETNSGPQGS